MDHRSYAWCLLLVFLAIVSGTSGARPGGAGGSNVRESGLPQARIGSLGWSTEQYSVSRFQESRINMRIIAMPTSNSDTIRGRGLWEVTVFGSAHADGSGQRYNQARNILSRSQESQTLYPGRELTFDVEFDFMMGQIGCDSVNFVCIEFSKGARANPDFEIPSTLGNSKIRTCQEKTCPFPDTDLRRALFTNIGFSANSGANPAPRGLSNMDITATVSTHQNSDRISGNNLWRLGVYGSQRPDGTGRKLNEMRNILSDSVASKPLIPGEDLILPGNANLNLQGIGTGQDYSYLCMELAKGDSPNPDFDLPMTSGSIVSCTSIQGTPVESGNPRGMISNFLSSYQLSQSYRDGTRDLTVEATITPHQDSDPISGSYLWKLGVYGSDNEQGTGRRYPVSDQLLRPPATNQPLVPGQDLEFSVTDNVDLRAIGPATRYPYICIEYGKNQYASPDFDLELGGLETVINCQLMRDPEDQGTGGGHGPKGSRPIRPGSMPRALVSQFSYQIGTAAVRGSHLTDVEITANISPFESTDTISGPNLWRLGLWGSRNADGEGSRMGAVRQMLPDSESGKTLESGQTLVVEGSTRTDLRGIGHGTAFPYLCVEFGPASEDPFFAFPVTPGPTLFSCKPYTAPTGYGGGDDPDMPNVLFTNFRAGITPSAIPNSHLTRLEVDATVIPDDRTDYVQDAQFRIGIFGNDMSDGTGSRVNEVRQILSPEDRTHPVYAGRNVEINVAADIDLRGMGVGTRYPYLCVEFDKKNDNVNFDMPMSTATGTFVTCYEFSAPGSSHGGGGGSTGGDLPVAQVTNMRNALNFVTVPGTDMLETTVISTITPHSGSDRIPASSTANWRLGIFGSDNPDGTGSRKKEVSQLLPRAQQRLALYPGRNIEFQATNQLDLNGVGTGTNYPYLCIEFSKAEGNSDFEFPQGSMVSCNQFQAPETHPEPHPEPGPQDSQVTVTEVVPDKNVKGKEKGTMDVTFDVVVSVNPSSDQVHGSDLWVLRVWASKKKNGKGPKLSEVPQALSQRQQQQAIENGRTIPFRDVSMTLDLSGTKCKDAKYLCAEISQGSNSDFTLEAPMVGCQKLKCQKKSKKDKTPPSSGGTTLAIRSIEPSRVTIFEERESIVRFTTTIEFDASQSQPLTRGSSLWQLSGWFNSEPDASNKYAKVEQLLSANKRDKYVRDVSGPFVFGETEFSVDLRDLTCRQLRFFCVKLTQDNPSPPFTFVRAVDNGNLGCSQTTCR